MSAHEAGRELDALVAEKVFGEKYDTYMGENENGEPALQFSLKRVGTPEHPLYRFGGPPRYSTDIAAAIDVLAQLGGRADIERAKPDEWYVQVGGKMCWAETLPLAICRAAIAAIEVPA